jgi:energy-coupling factor transporter transmembrane protein EcfT
VIHALARIDYHATSAATLWHRASALAKLLLAFVLLGTAVLSPGLRLLLLAHVLAWTLALSSRLPARLVLAAAGYPLAFALLFAIGRWDGTWQTPVRLLLRPLTASLTAVWLVGTTPYPDLFAPLSRVLPRNVGDGLFLTYRALFTLLERIERLWHALFLRGGFTGPVRTRLAHAGEGLGTLVVHGFERSQRLYATMLLRGHSGRVCGCRHYREGSLGDVLVGAVLVALFVAAIWMWRMP